jgi:uncharacterized Ntn-hydrolase superfamily protein
MPAGTYSIVAADPNTGECGVAVQSKFLAVGSLVPWAQAGVGAIATQAMMNPTYGPEGLRLLRSGMAPTQVVEQLTQQDSDRDHRQVGVVDAEGRAATYTGVACLDWAGGKTGSGYAAQGNILVSAATVDALARAFEDTPGRPLAARLLAGLAAAQQAGGDRRGQQAAALLVVRKGGGYGGCDVLVDLRIDDHPTPVAELERLYHLHQLYFGQTPPEDWLVVGEELNRELRARLCRLGYCSDDLAADLLAWAALENFELRVDGVERIDPVLLGELRARS